MADDAITDAIETNAQSPQSTSIDGVTVTNNPLSEQINAKKFLDANSAVAALASGNCWLPGVIISPPGARGGTSVDSDC